VGLTTGADIPSGGRQGGGSSFVSGKIDEVQTFVATTSVIGQGRVPDARGRLVFHLTVGPSGRTVVEFQRARFTCRSGGTSLLCDRLEGPDPGCLQARDQTRRQRGHQ